jgi:hypothetical protein
MKGLNMKCKQCDNEVGGRADKEFCNDTCRKKYVRSSAKADKNEVSADKIKLKADTVEEVEQQLESLTQGQKKEQRDSGWRFRTDLYRRALIDRIQAGEAEGSLEKHPRFGWLITRTPEQARNYNEKYGYIEQGHWTKKVGKKWLTAEEIKSA